MIKALTTFVLIGTVDSMDTQFATVEINYNPATAQTAAMAVIPITAFPCEIVEGDTFYIIKLDPKKDAQIVCVAVDSDDDSCGCTAETPCGP
tara:strand:- start:263 stop:538 length:276 start_codon:yes stop_codon:yes gene_type:complete